MHQGGCDCGAVRYEIAGELSGITLCHCSQCRRLSGYVWGSIRVRDEDFSFLQGEEMVQWHSSSDWARRGFCRTCGANLFYKLNEKDRIGVSAGSLDQPAGLHIRRHIFTQDKAEYYDIPDDAPQFERY